MRTPMRIAPALLLALLPAACSLSTPGAASENPRNAITAEELSRSGSESVYEAIEKLRPDWLTTRGPTSVTDATPTQPSVYIDGQVMGRAEYLRDIRTINIKSLKYWPAGPASARFGMGHPRGVIEVLR